MAVSVLSLVPGGPFAAQTWHGVFHKITVICMAVHIHSAVQSPKYNKNISDL
jgi:hypothetical protein